MKNSAHVTVTEYARSFERNNYIITITNGTLEYIGATATIDRIPGLQLIVTNDHRVWQRAGYLHNIEQGPLQLSSFADIIIYYLKYIGNHGIKENLNTYKLP